MKKKIFAALLALILMIGTSMSALATTRMLTYELPSVDDGFASFLHDVAPADFRSALVDNGLERTSLEYEVTRICAEDHVYGLNACVDEQFLDGRLFVYVFTISEEFQCPGSNVRSASCSPGRHSRVVIRSTSGPSTFHMGWGFIGGFCQRVTVINWVCEACNTIGTDRTMVQVQCWEC